MRNLLSIAICLLFLISAGRAQDQGTVFGIVKDSEGNPIPEVFMHLQNQSTGWKTDQAGTFRISLDEGVQILSFKHISFIDTTIIINVVGGGLQELNVGLQPKVEVLDRVIVEDDRYINLEREAGTITFDPEKSRELPSTFSDFTSILISLPGVSSNNEFSSAYSVRGGSFDENLVYVNDMPIYRPFIISQGQQEGLSFVNPSLVDRVQFSSGGWAPRFGDRLSSNLVIGYRRPDQLGGSFYASLLGAGVHLEGAAANQKVKYLLGARYKASKYLLNTLEVEGEYFPTFGDIQLDLLFDLDKDPYRNRTELEFLLSFASNNYEVIPSNRETEFGTFFNPLKVFVAFEGRERLFYRTYQNGLMLRHFHSEKLKSRLMVGTIFSREREFYDVEAGYRLCNVDKDPGSNTFDECVVNRGVGTDFQSGRNLMDVTFVNTEYAAELILNNKNSVTVGATYSWQNVNDVLNEYAFTDSARFSTITYAAQQENDFTANRFNIYAEHSLDANQHQLTWGLRAGYFDFNQQWLVSPRANYSYRPLGRSQSAYRFAVGLYQQPPIYREMRQPDGFLNTSLKAQSSLHVVGATDWLFEMWQRPFVFTVEAYYKRIWNAVPYDIDNVKIRYLGENLADAYAAGLDLRLHGDFIPGDQSWISIGILKTEENLKNDQRGYIPRPTDQRLNLAILFKDHLPMNKTFEVFLNFKYATALPFSPPGDLENRNSFRGEPFQRIDIGFYKTFLRRQTRFLDLFRVGVEVLNLTSAQNPISYYWVQDVDGINYAVPNSLSARFFNLKLSGNF